MRTNAEIIVRLESLKAAQQKALESRMVWTLTDISHQIRELEWVLS